MSREIVQAEAEMDQADSTRGSIGRHLVGQFVMAGGEPCLQEAPDRIGESVKDEGNQAFWFWDSVFTAADGGFCPKKHGEAMALPQAQGVRRAEIEEYMSHVQNVSFGPALEPGQYAAGPALKAVWVYSRSKKEPGAFKARVVMQGFLMQQGLHFNEVHAPVPAVTSFRVFILEIALQGRVLEHWDVKTAFLTTHMDCKIDVTLPEAFNLDSGLQPEARRGTERHRVLKVIPGCPQGSRLWYADLTGFLRDFGFTSIAPQEECVFIERDRPGGVHLLVWTDDICVSFVESDRPRVRTLFSALQQRYPNGIHEGEERGGELSILGTAIVRLGTRKLFIHQKPFLLKLLEKAGFGSGPDRGVQIPIVPVFVFTSKDCATGEADRKSEDSKWYRSVLMSVSYLANWTRPDVAFAVSKLARFMQAPGPKHVKELKRVLRYLRCNQDLGLMMDFSKPPSKEGLYGFFDASFADCIDTRRSTVAYVFFFGSATISWKTKLYSFVTTSSNHSELVASAMAAREAKFLLLLVTTLGFCSVATPRPVRLLAGRERPGVDLLTDSMMSSSSALSSATST